jgi:hypothetical protein
VRFCYPSEHMRYIRGVTYAPRTGRHSRGIVLTADGGDTQIHVHVVTESVIRVFLKRRRPWIGARRRREDASSKQHEFALDRTWSVSPSFGCDATHDVLVPLSGRPREWCYGDAGDGDDDNRGYAAPSSPLLLPPFFEVGTTTAATTTTTEGNGEGGGGGGGGDGPSSVFVSTSSLRLVLHATTTVDEGTEQPATNTAAASASAAAAASGGGGGVLFRMRWFWNNQGTWEALASDKKTGGILLGRRSDAMEHFMDRRAGEMYFGLGERTGNVNKIGRRYEMRSLDAMGYDAESTDPLYKHFPFYITRNPPPAPGRASAAYGLFYDNMSSPLTLTL